MPNMVDKERAKFIKDMQDEKAQYEMELRADPNDPAAKANLKRVNSVLRRYGAMVKDKDTPSDRTLTTLEKQQQMNRKPYNPEEDTKHIPMTKMADGGMAKGKGGKMYQHNYATGGQVVDHLSKVTGHPNNVMGRQMQQRRMPQSVQAMTAVPGESPAERSKRLRSGG